MIRYVQERVDQDLLQQLQHIVIMAEGGVKHGDVSRIAKAAGNAVEKPMHVAVLEGG